MIRSSLVELLSLAKKDSHLEKYLKTCIKDLPREVEYSLGKSKYEEFYNSPFLDYISSSLNRDPRLSLFLSVDGNSVLGWMLYVNGEFIKEISSVRMGSFYYGRKALPENILFMKDMFSTFRKKILERNIVICFTASKDCPFNRHYEDFINRAGGKIEDAGDGYIRFELGRRKKD